MESQEKVKNLNPSTWVSFDISKRGEVLRASEDLEKSIGIASKKLLNKNVVSLVDMICAERYKSKVVHGIRRVLSGNTLKANIFAEINLAENQFRVPVLIFIERKKHNKEFVSIVFHDLSGYDNFIKSIEEEKFRSSNLIEHGNIVIVRLDTKLAVKDIIGNTENLMGHSREDFLNNPSIWDEYLKNRFQKRLKAKLKNNRGKFTDEVSVVNSKTKRVHYILVSGLPVYSKTGKFDGWEGFGFDITEKKEAELKLKKERAKLNALYEVSKVIHVEMDPALVALKGLKALANATNADSGFVLFKKGPEEMQLTCSLGLSEEYTGIIQKRLYHKGLVYNSMKEKVGIIVDNLQEHELAQRSASKKEGLKSTLIVPMIYDDADIGLKSFGAIVLISKKANFFKNDDLTLVEAAASQIVLVARQAINYLKEKNLAASMKKTLEFTKEISGLKSLDKIAAKSISGITKEIPTRRFWIGVVNDQNTFLTGLGARGPGMDERVANVQLDLAQRNDTFKKILEREEAIILTKIKNVSCDVIAEIIVKHNIRTLIVLPLIAMNKLVGTIVIEPESNNRKYLAYKVPMLKTMASEIANIILSRRLEAKLIDAEKMRMAGLLASGVAHNFNNLLQAIMGQTSLIELQTKGNKEIKKATQTILDSATKGAGLIAQLMDLTIQKESKKERFSVNKQIKASQGLYKSLMKSKVNLRLNLEEDLPEVTADPSQIQHVISHLLVNASEASADSKSRNVRISTKKRKIAPNEVELNLSPGLYIQVDITDNGRGMDEEEINRCFEPFYTSKDSIGNDGLGLNGAGLGLPASYSIAKQHNGTLKVLSKKNVGTTVSLFIPAVTEVTKTIVRKKQKVKNKPKKHNKTVPANG